MPHDYPKSPPKASFKTKIYHPNVEESTGSVCLDTLKRDWQPKLTLRDILITISCLLINPNPDSALNSEAGKLLQEDFESFARKARLITSIHARVPSNLKKAVIEARTRGEEKQKAEITIYEAPDNSDTENDDEASASKENDPSISPTTVTPPPIVPLRRNTTLGKRPLSDLPTPEEPPSEDESQPQSHLSASEQNIAANTTPNLSGSFSSLSFSNQLPTSNEVMSVTPATHFASFSMSTHPTPNRRHAVPTSRLTERSPTSAAALPFAFTGVPTSSSNTNAQSNPGSHSSNGISDPAPPLPSAKRRRSDKGKENFTGVSVKALVAEDAENKAPTVLSTSGGVVEKAKTAPVGLGVRNVPGVKDGVRKGGIGANGARGKARVGLRRL